MASSNYKIVLFYNQYQQGFTETWYYIGTLDTFSFTNVLWDSFCSACWRLRAAGVTLVAARWSVVGAPRQSYTYFFGNKFNAPAQQIGLVPDISAEDLLIKINVAGGYSKHMYLRGLSQLDTGRSIITGGPKPSAALIQNVQAMITAAYNLGLCIQVQQTVASNPALPSAAVFMIAAATSNPEWSTLTLQTTLPLQGNPPYYVRFSGVPKNNVPGLPRTAQVLNYSAGPPPYIYIPYRLRASSTDVYPPKMLATQLLYSYPTLLPGQIISGNLQLINFLSRKTGKAFFVPRGRTRAAINRS